MTKPLDDARNWNADCWHLFLCQHCDNRATSPHGMNRVALKIADTMDALRAAPGRCDAESAVAAERERCAKIAVEFATFPGERFIKEIRAMCGTAIADKIRETPAVSSARGNTP